MLKTYGTPRQASAPVAFASRMQFFEGPLQLSWHHCGSTAEFLGDFFAARAGIVKLDPNEARHNIGYLVNELLENVVKFRFPGTVFLEASLQGSLFELTLRNFIGEETAWRFQAVLDELSARDPGELLIERIEANAADPSASGSGLGLLTLLNDYGARLGWTFRQAQAGGPIQLETYAALALA